LKSESDSDSMKPQWSRNWLDF